jgi:hypothetical protein
VFQRVSGQLLVEDDRWFKSSRPDNKFKTKNRAGKTVALQYRLVRLGEAVPRCFSVKKHLAKKESFSCMGEVFALDRCLLMGDPNRHL